MKWITNLGLAAICVIGVATVANAQDLNACLDAQDLPRVARVVDPQGQVVYAQVTGSKAGRVTNVRTLAPNGTPLAEVFRRLETKQETTDFAVADSQVCAVVNVPESAVDAETHVIVSTGLNYAAHAEEAGGGDVFLFPKACAPTSPYSRVHAPAGVTLFDYEVELAFVLLEDVDPFDPPSNEALMEKSAFFLTNDVSDREPIILNASLSGMGTGFVEGKGQPGFLPAGPWMIRGSDLMAGLERCGEQGLGLRLWIDDETEPRQDANTTKMILQPTELVARIGTWIIENGRRTSMPFLRPGEAEARFYPFAVPSESPLLTAGSIVQTGTPEGVALGAPSPLGVTLRGALRLRSPFEQFLIEEKARVAEGGTRYLAPGSVVRAQIDGLGEQQFRIGEAGGRAEPHACDAANAP